MAREGRATVVFGPKRLARLRTFCETNEREFSSAVQEAVDALMDGLVSGVPCKSMALTMPAQGNGHATAIQQSSPLTLPSPDLSLDPVLPFVVPTQTPPLMDGGYATNERGEIDWRVAETWAAHLRTREKFWLRENGQVQPASAAPRAEVRKAIVNALREFDADRLGPKDRERWTRESPVRAAGQGIFLDAWCTGHDKDNDVSADGKRYLEDFRPWKPQRGKGSPVPRFAALAFEARSNRAAG